MPWATDRTFKQHYSILEWGTLNIIAKAEGFDSFRSWLENEMLLLATKTLTIPEIPDKFKNCNCSKRADIFRIPADVTEEFDELGAFFCQKPGYVISRMIIEPALTRYYSTNLFANLDDTQPIITRLVNGVPIA